MPKLTVVKEPSVDTKKADEDIAALKDGRSLTVKTRSDTYVRHLRLRIAEDPSLQGLIDIQEHELKQFNSEE
jgi:redox-regulated HSP33 family molecular chaperone